MERFYFCNVDADNVVFILDRTEKTNITVINLLF